MRFHQGAWRIQVRAGVWPETGKPRMVFATVNEPNTKAGERKAAKVRAECVAEAKRLRESDASENVTLLAAIDAYVARGIKVGGKSGHKFSPTTVRNYQQARRWVEADKIGTQAVRRLTPKALTQFYDRVSEAHGTATARGVHGLCRSALALAVSRGHAEYNAATDAEKPPKPQPRKGHMRRLTPALVGEVLRYVEATDPYFYAWLRLSATVGARPSTLAGTRWRDLDLDAGVARFDTAVVRGTVDTPSKGHTVKGLKANNGYQVALDAATVEALRRQRRWVVERFDSLAAVAPDRWVFPRPHCPKRLTEPVTPSAMTSRWYRLRRAFAEDRGQLDGLQLYDLRHYVATNLLNKGVEPAKIAQRLGHTNVTTTLTVYAEFLPPDDQDAADMLAADIDGQPEAEAG